MLELPPTGTRGAEVPKAVRPILRAMSGIGSLMVRFGAKVQGRPLLRLVTVGARTGKRREVVLGWFPDDERDDAWRVVASNGGSARHPDWAYNLAKNPEDALVDFGDREIPVKVELLSGVEREFAWDDVLKLAPGYSAYLEKTDRELPIFTLVRRA